MQTHLNERSTSRLPTSLQQWRADRASQLRVASNSIRPPYSLATCHYLTMNIITPTLKPLPPARCPLRLSNEV